jgi:hypothetical protein
VIERSNFSTASERPIPASAPPEFRRRITEVREQRDAAPKVEVVTEVPKVEDPERWEILKKYSALSGQE